MSERRQRDASGSEEGLVIELERLLGRWGEAPNAEMYGEVAGGHSPAAETGRSTGWAACNRRCPVVRADGEDERGCRRRSRRRDRWPALGGQIGEVWGDSCVKEPNQFWIH